MPQYSPKVKNFSGNEGTIILVGVVESRIDPLKLGRCKVRYIGWHTADKDLLPTDALPWSKVLVPIDSGRSVVGLREGDWVEARLIDGALGQEPLIYGLHPGYAEKEADPKKGFYDPRPDYLLHGHKVPRDPLSWPEQHDDGSGSDMEELKVKSRFPQNEPKDKRLRYVDGREPIATNRYERREEIKKSIVHIKRENVKIGQEDIPMAFGGDWTEPKTPYGAVYPYNHTYWSESGHLTEIDDTPKAERLHQYHRSGTFHEVHPNGLVVDKIVDTEIHIVLKSRMTHIEASDNNTVDWGSKLYINKDKKAYNYDIWVGEGGCMNTEILEGDWNLIVHGNVNVLADENINLHAKKNINCLADDNINLMAQKDITMSSGKDTIMIVGGNHKHVTMGNSAVATFGNKYKFTRGAEFNATLAAQLDLVTSINVRYQTSCFDYSLANHSREASGLITDVCTDYTNSAVATSKRFAGTLILDSSNFVSFNALAAISSDALAVFINKELQGKPKAPKPGFPNVPPAVIPPVAGAMSGTAVAVITAVTAAAVNSATMIGLTNASFSASVLGSVTTFLTAFFGNMMADSGLMEGLTGLAGTTISQAQAQAIAASVGVIAANGNSDVQAIASVMTALTAMSADGIQINFSDAANLIQAVNGIQTLMSDNTTSSTTLSVLSGVFGALGNTPSFANLSLGTISSTPNSFLNAIQAAISGLGDSISSIFGQIGNLSLGDIEGYIGNLINGDIDSQMDFYDYFSPTNPLNTNLNNLIPGDVNAPSVFSQIYNNILGFSLFDQAAWTSVWNGVVDSVDGLGDLSWADILPSRYDYTPANPWNEFGHYVMDAASEFVTNTAENFSNFVSKLPEAVRGITLSDLANNIHDYTDLGVPYQAVQLLEGQLPDSPLSEVIIALENASNYLSIISNIPETIRNTTNIVNILAHISMAAATLRLGGLSDGVSIYNSLSDMAAINDLKIVNGIFTGLRDNPFSSIVGDLSDENKTKLLEIVNNAQLDSASQDSQLKAYFKKIGIQYNPAAKQALFFDGIEVRNTLMVLPVETVATVPAPEGFIWIPKSDYDKTLVVIVPAGFNAADCKLIADGKDVWPTDVINISAFGSRSLAKFPLAGNKYPANTIVVLSNKITVTIPNTSVRYEGKTSDEINIAIDNFVTQSSITIMGCNFVNREMKQGDYLKVETIFNTAVSLDGSETVTVTGTGTTKSFVLYPENTSGSRIIFSKNVDGNYVTVPAENTSLKILPQTISNIELSGAMMAYSEPVLITNEIATGTISSMSWDMTAYKPQYSPVLTVVFNQSVSTTGMSIVAQTGIRGFNYTFLPVEASGATIHFEPEFVIQQQEQILHIEPQQLKSDVDIVYLTQEIVSVTGSREIQPIAQDEKVNILAVSLASPEWDSVTEKYNLSVTVILDTPITTPQGTKYRINISSTDGEIGIWTNGNAITNSQTMTFDSDNNQDIYPLTIDNPESPNEITLWIKNQTIQSGTQDKLSPDRTGLEKDTYFIINNSVASLAESRTVTHHD